MAMKNRMRLGGLIAGLMPTVLANLMLAKGLITLTGNPALVFIENMNRSFMW